jgi:adenosine/AMP kinase
MEIPEGTNIILGQTHFIKTVEDIYEIMVTTVPGAKFGIAFCEASGPCLIRSDGNDEALVQTAIKNCQAMGAGHVFNLIIRDAYPINVLNNLKHCQEICTIFCATANPVEVILAQSETGRGVIGVIDGFSPKGIETDGDKNKRREFLRKIAYKK